MTNKYYYTLELKWLGNENGTHHRTDRFYEISIDEKAKLKGSADKPFFGDPTLYNPEDLLLSALSACHMMSYLYLCRKQGIKISSYQDNAQGILKLDDEGIGRFESVILRPQVVLADSSQIDEAFQLHTQAGKLCFIANSVNFDISYDIKTT
jgi:organic hydroperoxide reductase OsmC/OhrA